MDEEVKNETKVEEIKNEKPQKRKKEKDSRERSLFSKIANIVLWIILFVWMGIVFFDFYRVTTKKDPVLCISKDTIEYDDGNVYSCLGLGYKVYKYDRASYSALEFGPFWSKDRSNEESK